MTHAEFVSSLRELADFYEARPALPLPSVHRFPISQPSNIEGMAHCARLMAPIEKEVNEYWFKVTRKVGHFTLYAFDLRSSICDRVQVGTKTIPEQHIKAREAETIPEHEEPQYEWRCPESLLGDK